jgi:hypothetical protein
MSRPEVIETSIGQSQRRAGTRGIGSDERVIVTIEPEIDKKFRCVDCGKDTKGGEYYSVKDELWAASGMDPNGGMLCLLHLEERIGRWLALDDFTALTPSAECWQRHIAARGEK